MILERGIIILQLIAPGFRQMVEEFQISGDSMCAGDPAAAWDLRQLCAVR
jgi:hypothetical protein